MKKIILIFTVAATIIALSCKKKENKTEDPEPQPSTTGTPTPSYSVDIFVNGHCTYGSVQVEWNYEAANHFTPDDSTYAYQSYNRTVKKVITSDSIYIILSSSTSTTLPTTLCASDVMIQVNGVVKLNLTNQPFYTQMGVKVN